MVAIKVSASAHPAVHKVLVRQLLPRKSNDLLAVRWPKRRHYVLRNEALEVFRAEGGERLLGLRAAA